jgi:glycosyltransferase involved in cell wall biosynthesis
MDVCVVPQSNPYRSPIKLFEYMATGKAVVAPRTEPIEMVARDGEHAVLFDPDCADDLTGALRRMLGDAPLREQLGRAAREHVLHHHTWQRNAELMLDLLPQPLTRQPS